MPSHRGRPEDSPYIAWFDLETTGNREDDSIIEVGFVLTDRDLNEVGAASFVAQPWDWNFLRTRMDGVVVKMHTDNELLFDVSRSKTRIEEVDAEIASILKRYGGGNHIPLAGSGVSHFDRQYIKRELPKANDLLSYWSLDIGVMRRWLQWWGIETPGSELLQAKTHRALDDIREHIGEARVIRRVLQHNAELSWRYANLTGA